MPERYTRQQVADEIRAMAGDWSVWETIGRGMVPYASDAKEDLVYNDDVWAKPLTQDLRQ